MRWIAAIAVGVALAFAVPVSSADAAKMMSKKCSGTTLAGKKMSFKCPKTSTCCWDAITEQGTCVPAGSMCL